jgi:hypothetical protein
MRMILGILVGVLALAIGPQPPQEKPHEHTKQEDAQTKVNDCPMHAEHAKAADHHAEVNKRGDQAMGFSQEKTTHHFRLYSDGGAIEVVAKDEKDLESRDEIRVHLRHISHLFAAGDFALPHFIHAQVPPGVPVMLQRKDSITYRYEETSAGGRVRIISSDPAAIASIHDFLRFQINDHRTGDQTLVTTEAR